MKRLVMVLFLGFASSQAAYSDVDSEMRAAYTVWEEAFRENNVPTTPAYDVVGLLAAIGRMDLFDDTIINGTGPERKLGAVEKWILKEEYRAPENLGKLFSHHALKALQKEGKLDQNLLIVTDFGEEADDEVTALLASKLMSYGMRVHILFTSSRADEQIGKYRKWLEEARKNQIGYKIPSLSTLEEGLDLTKFFPKGKTNNSVLQIGPIHINRPGFLAFSSHLVKSSADISYNYFLLGEYGKTLNSKGDSTAASFLFHLYSQRTHIIDTARGRGAFPFTYEALKTLFGKDHSIIDHVAKIGWRNTVGRANPFAGIYVAHLVAPRVGANYKTVRGLVEAFEALGKAPVKEITDSDRAAAVALAERYLDALQTTAPEKFKEYRLVVKADGSTNNVARVRVEQIIEGYTYILLNLYKWFGVPVEFFESGKEEKWKAQWETPSQAEEGQGVLFGLDKL